ncbi:class I SAM-dependent methyltransferase [Cellulomonas sp. JH27-2]|uniref:class I SAM-dependent methyltransferase n=1 Tax=Cellulomonas sp. JH27-2 TaxID=2774139 RepID=UPI00178457E6|nr:class I SAM-dependent methyltransferase [Cellulomonas sp. JH27-2]MBD8059063.1 class I SAM-dependent methyltransferase [Cellulomonas sp. JH27-2]
MRSFDELVAEGDAADVSGWGFGWLDGRATEERPPWSYVTILGERLAQVRSALDLDTGGGEVLDEASTFPPRMVVTEGWPPNAAQARDRLGPRGVEVVEVRPGERLPFDDGSFELVTSRHPVAPDWAEIHRVLAPGGHYVAQHVGPASAFELIEYFLGPLPENRKGRDPVAETAAARDAGLEIVDLRTARCRIEVFDVGAVVWLLRKCVWWVPDFSVERYRSRLVELDAQLRGGTPFVAHSTRHLVDARRPA